MYKCVKCCAISAAVVIGMITLAAQADVIFVKAVCDGGGDNGISWADAHCGSQGFHDALARAVVGDELWVAQGIYTPAEPDGDRTISFEIPSGVRIYGGFSGDEINLDDRDPDVFETVFSGDLNGDDIRDMIPFPTNPWENAFHVFTLSDTGEGTLIDSCTITSGFSSGQGNLLQDRGGNIQMTGGDLTVRRCSIQFGYGQAIGGGISVDGGDIVVEDCLFLGNSAADFGGGMAVYKGGKATITRCEFRENIGGVGCAIFVGQERFTLPEKFSSIILSDSKFIQNIGLFGSSWGGAIRILYGNLLATRCDFIDNKVDGGGGAIFSLPNDVRFESCRFFGNDAPGDGGGAVFASVSDIFAVPPRPTTFTSCLFVGNNGVCSSVFDGVVEFVSCTIANNTVSVPFLGWPTFSVQDDSGITIHNSIVWNNDPFGDSRDSDDQFVRVGFLDPVLDIRNSIIQAWDGSIPGDAQAIDPMFVDVAGADGLPGTLDDDLRLMIGSPAINIGSDALLRGDASDLDQDGDTAEPMSLDLDGNPRVVGAVDLGAYEFQAVLCVADLTGDGNLNFFDVSAFLGAFTSQDSIADFTGDGLYNFFDVSAFLNAYAAGCL